MGHRGRRQFRRAYNKAITPSRKFLSGALLRFTLLGHPELSQGSFMSTSSARASRRPLALAVALALGLGLGNAHAASITVTDGGDAGSPTTCTLRQAIEAANNDAVEGTCAAGNGIDTITFSGTLTNSTITLSGTELEVTDDLVITGSGQTIDANGASRVLSVYDSTGLTASNLIITGGATSDEGGGINVGEYGNLTLADSTVSGNRADRTGGGIYGWGRNTLSITNSTISGNQAGYNGGGIYAWLTTLNLTNSTISGNQTSYNGGGVYATNNSTFSMTNSTISGNQASYNGGGIHGDELTLSVDNSTITGNNSDTAGGGILVSNYDSVVVLQNTLLAGNAAPDGIDLAMGVGGGEGPQARRVGKIGPKDSKSINAASTVTVSASLLGTALAGTYSGNGNVFSNTPGLGALANNGGATLSMLPQPGSPLIDAGNNSLIPMGVTFDQRGAGFPRIVGGRVDIGAVEAAAVVAASQPTLVPAGSTWTLSLLGLLLGTLGFFGLRGRQQSP